MAPRCRPLLVVALLILAGLACAKTPSYELRGWTATPPPSTPTAPVTATPIPVVPPPAQAPIGAGSDGVVMVENLEVRTGAGEGFPSIGILLRRGDSVKLMGCQVIDGNTWVSLYAPERGVLGWAAGTWEGATYIWPLMEGCDD